MSPRNPPSSTRRRFLQLTGCALGSTALLQTAGRARASGRLNWTYDTGAPVFSSPTIVNETAYVGSQNGAVYALDTETGEYDWISETGGPVDSSPFVIDRQVGDEGENQQTVLVGSDDTLLYALDAQTGEQEWGIETEGRVQGSPVVGADTLFFTSDNDGIYAVDTNTGELRWSEKFRTASFASPTVIENTVFLRSDRLRALDPKTGWQRWEFKIGSGTYSSPTVSGGTVYIGDRGNNGEPGSSGNLYALDVSSGDKRWQFESEEFIDSSPAVADETVYVGGWNAEIGRDDANDGDTGSVFALDAETGEKRWQFETGGRVLSSPTVADGTVFVGSWDNCLYALDAETGEEQFQFETGDKVSSSPTVSDGTVYVGSNDGRLYALDAGVTGSSGDSRVQLGTLGHNGTKTVPETLEPNSRLDTLTAQSLGAGGAIGFLAGSGLLYWGNNELAKKNRKESE